MKFIHIADVHLGMMPEEKRGFGSIRKKEIEETFERLLLEAKRKQIDFIMIVGDLYHRSPLIEELQELNAKFEQLAPTKVVLIAGNHDCILENSPYERFSFAHNVIVLKDETIQSVYVKEHQVTFWGLSYHKKEITSRLYDDVKPEGEGYHMLLAHGGDEAHIPMDYEKLKWAGFDYVALGHIHKPQVIVQDFMNYAGSLEPLDRTEKGEHGYFLGEITEEGQRVVFVPFSKRRYEQLNIEIEETETVYQILNRIREEMEARGRENFYDIYLNGYTPLSKRIQLETLEQDYFITEIVDNTKKNYDIEKLYEDNKENVLGKFIQEMNKISDPIAKEAMELGIEALLETKLESKG